MSSTISRRLAAGRAKESPRQPEQTSRKKIFALIDGKSVFYRGFYAMPNLSTKDGTPTGGVYGFASLALELLSRIKPDYVAVAWDKPKTNVRRRLKIYDQYKANRHAAPPDFYAEIPILHELLQAFGWPLYELDDYEADDIMGTLSEQANAQGIHTIMISSDLDMLQLIDHDTEFYALKKGLANLEKFDPEHFREKYGVRVDQFLDVKALKGDASDNIPGVAGIGEKTALDLIQQFGTLENVFANVDSAKIRPVVRAKLIAGKDSAFMSRDLAKIWTDAPIKLDLTAVDVRNLNPTKLRDELRKLEFTSLIRRLPEFMRENDPKAEQPMLVANFRESNIVELNDSAKEDLQKSEVLAVIVGEKADTNSDAPLLRELDGGSRKYLLLAADEQTAYKTDFATGVDILHGKKVITHDAKELAEKFLRQHIEPNFTVAFDTRLAKFLLNSLRKSPTLAEAIGWTGDMVDGVATDLPDGAAAGGLWSLFRETETELKKFAKLNTLAREVDFPLQIVIAKVENRGVKLDKTILKKMSGELAAKIRDYEKQIWQIIGHEFNVSSAPQLSDALFRDLKLPATHIKKSIRGYYSTSKSELDKLRGVHPIIDLISEVREVLKMKNTYVDALPLLAGADGKLHTDFRQDITATGRLSSSNPNLQNIPTRSDLGRAIRRAFVASPGKILISGDYAQFELRLAAAMSGDTKLIQIFANDDIDVHTQTAAEVFKVAPEDVTPNQRRAAKVINFGVLYGMSPHSLAQNTGMDFANAKEFIDNYFEARTCLREHLDATIKKAETDGYVETLFGRRRPTPDVKSANFQIREAAKRAAANMPFQGTEADLMKMAMLKVEKEFREDVATQILQIHDSILLECDPKHADSVAKKLRDIMENIYPPIGVKLRVDVKTGKNWSEL